MMPDIILDAGREFLEHNGRVHALGCMPPHADSGLPKFAAAPGAQIIPRSEWIEVDYEWALCDVKDQNGFSACVGHGVTSALEGARSLAGYDKQPLSAWLSYACVNGGQDQGAITSDCLKTLKEVGTCLESTVPYGTFQKSKIPATAFKEAERFRLFEGYKLDSFDELMSALMLGYLVPFGVLLGNRFEPDANGHIPEWDKRNVGGHCMLAFGTVQVNRVWRPRVRNSWGKKWSTDGNCTMPQSYFDGQPWKCDAFAIQAVYRDPMGPGIPVVSV